MTRLGMRPLAHLAFGPRISLAFDATPRSLLLGVAQGSTAAFALVQGDRNRVRGGVRRPLNGRFFLARHPRLRDKAP